MVDNPPPPGGGGGGGGGNPNPPPEPEPDTWKKSHGKGHEEGGPGKSCSRPGNAPHCD